MKEIWKDIPGFEGYYSISNKGRVLSIRTGKMKKPSTYNNKSYPTVSLWVNGIPTRKSIHRLVAELFIPNPENKTQVNHIDGDKTNYSINNLEWVTPSENMTHAFKNNLVDFQVGEQCSWAKLTENDVLKIFELKNNGMSNLEISKRFNISNSQVSNIFLNKRWKQLETPEVKLETKYTKGQKIKDQYGNVYNTMTEAAKKLNLSIGNISMVLDGKRNHTGGFIFTRAEETVIILKKGVKNGNSV